MKFCVPLLALLLNANGESLASSHLPYLQVVQKDQQLIDIRLTVVDKSSGEPIEGVSIMVGNRQVGSTNASGVFQKEVIKGTEISFKRIGYAQSSIKANKNNIRVELSPLDESIDEVVVTALGIKRDEKALGYATTTVKGEQLTEALSSNWMDALSGKVAGLNLMRSNAGPVGTTKIILRGENNITGENEALIIVDGVMVNGGSGRRSALDSDNAYGVSSENMPVDYGSGMDDINPEDIETITVLKGPGAAALYGQRAANGAIVITTKSGSKKDKGIGVTVNSRALKKSS